MIKWVILCGVNLVLAVADGILTYWNTPDLSLEGNFLVAGLGFGWEALLIANVAVFGFCVFTAYYSFVRYKTVVLKTKNIKEYISQMLYNRPDKFIWLFYKTPKNRKPFYAILGFAFCYSMILGRMIAILEWTAISFKMDLTGYCGFIRMFPFGRMDIVLILIALMILILLWFVSEYRKSIKSFANFHELPVDNIESRS